MKLSNYISFSFDFLTKKKKQLIMLTIIMSLGISLMILVLTLLASTRKGRTTCDETLTYGNSNTGYFSVQHEKGKMAPTYIEMLENEGFKTGFIIRFNGGCPTPLKELQKIQSKLDYYVKENKSTGIYGVLDYVEMSPKLWDAFDIELAKGSKPEEVIPENEAYVYVGKNVNVEIGTEYICENYKVKNEMGDFVKDENGEYVRRTLKYIVMGQIEEGSSVINPNISKGDIDYISDTTINLDNMVLIVANNPIDGTIYDRFFYSDNPEEFAQKFKKMKTDNSFENGIGCETVEHIFDNMDEKNKEVINYILRLTILIMLSVIIIQSCSKIADIIINVKEYGIYFANGFTKINIFVIMLIEALWRFIICSSIAIAIIFSLARFIIFENYLYEYTMNLIYSEVLVKALAISAAVLLMAQMIPMIFISRIDVATLTKANE